MFDIYLNDEIKFLAFSIVVMRILSTLVNLPLFDSAAIPIRIKVLFSFLLAYAFNYQLGPIIEKELYTFGQDNLYLIFTYHILVGLLIGFILKVILVTLAASGSIISQEMGLGAINMFDPSMEKSVGPFEKIHYWMLVIFLINLDGLLPLLKGVVYSFQRINLIQYPFNATFINDILNFFYDIFLSSLLISIPFIFINMAMLFLLGVIARAIPQINVLVVSFALSIILGITSYYITFEELSQKVFEDYTHYLGLWFNFMN